MMMTYKKTTGPVTVTVEPSYMDDQSAPDESRYVWSYKVVINNDGKEAMQLRSRYWRITDANGVVQEVSGEGVVGEQPTLRPGESFEYQSGAPLPTPGGFMVGTYTMQRPDGSALIVEIPAFSLDSPYQSKVLH